MHRSSLISGPPALQGARIRNYSFPVDFSGTTESLAFLVYQVNINRYKNGFPSPFWINYICFSLIPNPFLSQPCCPLHHCQTMLLRRPPLLPDLRGPATLWATLCSKLLHCLCRGRKDKNVGGGGYDKMGWGKIKRKWRTYSILYSTAKIYMFCLWIRISNINRSS